ncbi:MlaD family protein [Bdellovibrio sp. 22V]|uniref:MlaD family protein n=1 Tax=Bdellovibrio TaxID=958 RepID=UPI00254384B5|nr:MlaD family protein [Bdellovibrio sp. 22V]WII72406.1 MlaD family protein [Bdellovibrio sp. 22V]
MESQTSTQLKVGIFLAIGTIFILGSIFFLGADKALFTSYVRIHAHFDQVQGLSAGSVVSLSGVTVGNVESITFLPEANALDVKMRINEDYIQRIRQGSQVEIRTQGALGDKYVFIIPSDPKGKVVQEGDILDVAKATDILGVLTERGNEANKVFDIINELHAITKTLNAENRLGRVMSNLDSAAMNFSTTSKDMRQMMSQVTAQNTGEKLGQSIDRLDSILTKIDKGQGSLGALINDPSVHNQLKSMLGGSARKNHVKTLLRTSIEEEDKK